MQVPTFVLLRGGRPEAGYVAEACAAGERFGKVAGDVSLGYARRGLRDGER